MNERLLVTFPLYVQPGRRSEDAAAKAMLEHQHKFMPLFERMIDIEDARVTVAEGCLEIENIEVMHDEWIADVQFMSSFYAGCKDMNSDDWHDATLFFSNRRWKYGLRYRITNNMEN